jgi:serine/threonine-protein kinase
VFGAIPEPTAATAVAAAPPEATDEELAALAYPVEPLPPEEEEERRRRRNRWLIALAVILLLAGAGLAFALTRPEKVAVPDVVGKQYEAARIVLVNAGFKVQRDGVTSSVVKDRVLREDPQPGSKVKKGDTITLTASDGPGTAIVPDVTNLPEAKAKQALKDAGFKTTVQTEASDTIPKGRATKTSPSGGDQIERGTLITLFVSSGPAKVTVPNVTGQNEASASAELSNVGLKADATQEESNQDPGTVIRQSPTSGSKVDKGATVTIVVAKAPTKVAVPGVVGQNQGEASSSLSAAGLTVITDTQDVTDPAQDGIVVGQNPAAGTKVKKGSTVTITVGKFTAPTPTTPGGTGTPGQ